MKKRLIVVFTLLLCAMLPMGAMAEALDLIVSAQVVAKNEIAVKAPASGDLTPFDWREGDVVKAGEDLFTVEPEAVYADMDGTIAVVHAGAGEIADVAMSRYGSVLEIEYENRYEIQANAGTGHGDVDNRNLYVGTQVYLRSASGRRFADGRILSVNGRNFTVEVIGGDLVFNQDVKIYRDPEYKDNRLLAKGKLNSIAPYNVGANGTIVDMAVKVGDEVKAGDLLFTYVPDSLDPERRGQKKATTISAEQDLILSAISAAQGGNVQKGQTLCTAYAVGNYQLAAKVEEGDILKLAIGDTLQAVFEDLGTESAVVTVASISAVGSDEDISRYTVFFDFEAPHEVLLGMHATVRP